jgi:beta-lactamase class A
MRHSRREFISGAAGAAAVGILAREVSATTSGTDQPSPDAILSAFRGFPGNLGIKIYAPASNGKPELLIQSNTSKVLLIGSAFKAFVLCEALRQADSPDVVKTIGGQQLELDASVWSADSATFNPPNLIGKVSERTALEAMIMHSDNTGTDMCLKYAGPDKVRSFIASAGLKDTRIPDSTRSFIGYLFGAKDYKNFTWDELCADANASMVNPALNNIVTMASSADDLVSFYSRALQGEFFHDKATLNEFRRILSLGDAIPRIVPLGASGSGKGGSLDMAGFHALCVAGGMTFDERWVFFSLAINWTAAAVSDLATVQAFAAACGRSLATVKDALACKG